jgi:intracellular sulfur oxidation DsrE/DsrF family protein
MASGQRRCSAAIAVWLIAASALAFGLVPTAPAAAASSDTAADKPFAEHHLVLQLSDDAAKKQALVISVAYNLLKFYGPDKIDIEVVAFGPGIALLRADSPNRKFVDSLVAQGVRFDVCMNTVETVERETGHRVPLNPNAKRVNVGVGQILALTEKGYTLVRP